LREYIETGEIANVLAPAKLKHPQTPEKAE